MANIPDRTSKQMQWDVELRAIDDLEEIPTREELNRMLKSVAKEFHRRLKQELERGMVPYSFGPVVEESSE